jgi:lambda repressor-like predicted transcriptional regulator
MVTRAEYLNRSLSRRKPWLAEGISRRTWERRQHKFNAADGYKAESKSASGTAARAAYLERTLSRRQPWLAEGISRRTFERRRRKNKVVKSARGKRLLIGAGRNRNRAENVAVGTADQAGTGKRGLRRQQIDLLMSRVHDYLDAQGIRNTDTPALIRAIRAVELPEPFKDLDVGSLVKVYRRSRNRLPARYERWIALIEKWDKAYTRRRARALVDDLITALADRPPRILDRMFAHLERQVCHAAKKVKRVEEECKRLKNDEWHFTDFRSKATDADKERVYAEVALGPKTKKDLARKFGKTVSAISNIGLRLRNDGLITSIWRNGQFLWSLPSPDTKFIPAREAIVEVLKKNGPMTVSALARETGKGIATIKSALHRHLLPDRKVIRTKLGTYALKGMEPQYVSNGEKIVAALAKGAMTFQMLVRETGITSQSLPQFLEVLRAKEKIVRVRRGMYARRGRAQEYVATSDLIVTALAKQPLKRGALAREVNKLTPTARSRGAIGNVLDGLFNRGIVGQEKPYGEYHLVQ